MDISEFIRAVKKYDFDMSFKVMDDKFWITMYYNNGHEKHAFTSSEKISLITGIHEGLFKTFFFSHIENLMKKIMKYSCTNYGIIHRCKTCQNKKFRVESGTKIKECFVEKEIKKINNFDIFK